MTDGSNPTYRAQNIGRVRIIGYELTTMGDFNFFGYNYRFLAGYTFTYPVDLNIIENRPDGKSYWEYFIDSFDGLDDAEEASRFADFAGLADPSNDNYNYFLNAQGSISIGGTGRIDLDADDETDINLLSVLPKPMF